MATATPAQVPPAPATDGNLYRLSLDEYHRLAESGILRDTPKVVLLDGVLVNKLTKGDPHIASTRLTVQAVGRILPAGWVVGKEDPIALPAGPTGFDSEPEPDVTVIRGEIRDYAGRKALPPDIALVVEVADSSLRKDRAALARYAHAGIPAAWIVNLNDRVVEASTEPTGPGDDPRYLNTRTYKPGDLIPVALDGAEGGRVAVDDLLP